MPPVSSSPAWWSLPVKTSSPKKQLWRFQSTFLKQSIQGLRFSTTSYSDILLLRSRSSSPSTLCQAARGFWLSRSRPLGFTQLGCPGTPLISPTSSRTTRMLNSCSFSVGIDVAEIFSGNFVTSGYSPGSVEMWFSVHHFRGTHTSLTLDARINPEILAMQLFWEFRSIRFCAVLTIYLAMQKYC